MKLYKISQNINKDYDTYSDAVVCAKNEEEARLIHPSGENWDGIENRWSDWTDAENVKVEYIGEASEVLLKGVICASFHAG